MVSSPQKVSISPSKLAHLVLRTNNLEVMRDFYLQFLGAEIAFEVPNVLSFMRYDEEHHRLGLIHVPDIGDKVRKSNGLEVSNSLKNNRTRCSYMICSISHSHSRPCPT